MRGERAQLAPPLTRMGPAASSMADDPRRDDDRVAHRPVATISARLTRWRAEPERLARASGGAQGRRDTRRELAASVRCQWAGDRESLGECFAVQQEVAAHLD